jgi:short-subunit dehydrogenase
MPGPTDTDFFETADLIDTKVGASENKDDPAMVAKAGYDAMLRGDGHEVSGFANKMEAMMTACSAMTISRKCTKAWPSRARRIDTEEAS